MTRYSQIFAGIREIHRCPEAFIPLHAPVFAGKEHAYVADTIDSTFVSSVGEYVTRFEEMLTRITGAKYAIATTSGTAALHAALLVAGVERDDLVITQAASFAATANAIAYTGAQPLFIDIARDTLGLSPVALEQYLSTACVMKDGVCCERSSGRRISACVPMHTFGHPCNISELAALLSGWNIALVEDAAEALGSYSAGQHAGTFGKLGILSFNGNKIVTAGGGGAILTDDETLARRAKHLTTTAKVAHPWEYVHDQIGFNYRMPNLNAALACAQLEMLDALRQDKRAIAEEYATLFQGTGYEFVQEPENCSSNYWLNAIWLADKEERDEFLAASNASGIMTRPMWTPLHQLPMFASAPAGPLAVTMEAASRLVNIPSSPRKGNV